MVWLTASTSRRSAIEVRRETVAWSRVASLAWRRPDALADRDQRQGAGLAVRDRHACRRSRERDHREVGARRRGAGDDIGRPIRPAPVPSHPDLSSSYLDELNGGAERLERMVDCLLDADPRSPDAAQ